MNKKNLVIAPLLLGALLCQIGARAQDLVQFPKGPAGWTVDVTPSSNPKRAVPIGVQVSQMEVSQDAQKRRTQAKMSNGRTDERWSISATNMILIQDPNGNVFDVPNGEADGIDYGLPYSESAFSWVTPSTLVEKDPISYQGRQCFHYKGTVRKIAYGAPVLIHVEAWIDAKTQLPVAFDDGTWLATYSFHPPPYAPLTIPPNFQKTFDRLSR